MESSEIIEHEGIISGNTGSSVLVSIITTSACSGCHAKKTCNMHDNETRLIEVKGKYDFRPGDQVNILMQQSMGFTALFYGYVLPFFILLGTLIISIAGGLKELTAGLTSLSVLIPYYGLIYLFRKKINEKFEFKLKV